MRSFDVYRHVPDINRSAFFSRNLRPNDILMPRNPFPATLLLRPTRYTFMLTLVMDNQETETFMYPADERFLINYLILNQEAIMPGPAPDVKRIDGIFDFTSKGGANVGIKLILARQ